MRDLPAVRRELDGVAEQVGEQLLEAVGVALDAHRLEIDHRDLEIAVFRQDARLAVGFADDDVEVKLLKIELEFAVVGARQQQQVVDEPRHAMGFAFDGVQRFGDPCRSA